MGITSGPEVYQQRMEQVFEGLPGLFFCVAKMTVSD